MANAPSIQGSGAKQGKGANKHPIIQPEVSVKKKGGGTVAVVIIIVVLLLLIGGFIYEEITFNFLGFRDKFVEGVIKLDPEFKALETRQADIDSQAKELDVREKALDSRENQLLKLQLDLKIFEEELDERSTKLTPVYRLPMSEEDLADMDSLSKTYSNMDPATAAGILASLYDKQDIAAILYYMSERSAASILAVMDTRLAADITQILLYK